MLELNDIKYFTPSNKPFGVSYVLGLESGGNEYDQYLMLLIH
jgi:hypothetical protein